MKLMKQCKLGFIATLVETSEMATMSGAVLDIEHVETEGKVAHVYILALTFNKACWLQDQLGGD